MKYKIKKHKTWYIVYWTYWFWLNRYYRRIDNKKYILPKSNAMFMCDMLNNKEKYLTTWF